MTYMNRNKYSRNKKLRFSNKKYRVTLNHFTKVKFWRENQRIVRIWMRSEPE